MAYCIMQSLGEGAGNKKINRWRRSQ